MGQLALPHTGTVYLDTSAVIYAVEKIEPFAQLLAPLWDEAHAGRLVLVGSQLLLLEALVQPTKNGDVELEEIYRELLTGSGEFRLYPITLAVLERAVRLRAEYSLRTPDAIHAATALLVSCSQFITNDAQFKRVLELPVVIMRDYVA